MNLQELNDATTESAEQALTLCCGSSRWVKSVLAQRPFADKNSLLAISQKVWLQLDREDWLEAFTHHPKIGDVDSLRKKFAATKQWAEGEQGAVKEASEATLEALAQANAAYEKKFGYIFIVCATGKSAEQMLTLLQARMNNAEDDEILVAMQEQNKITGLRLEKLLS